MDVNTKVYLGKILGEIYRIQKRMDPNICPLPEETVYALLNGIEPIIDEVIVSSIITEKEYDSAVDILSEIDDDPDKKKKFKGFYDIESKLADIGIGRGKAIRLFKYIKASGGFQELFEKMNSSDSPSECKSLKLNEWDK